MNGKQLKIGEEVKENVDKLGNRWFVDGNTVFLRLAEEKISRKLGVLFDNRFIVYRNRERHLMRNTNSYGFNEQVINTLEVDFVDIYEEKQMFRVPKEILLTQGENVEAHDGFEKQIFLPISIIETFKTVIPEDLVRIDLLGEEWFYKLKEEFHKPYMIMLGRTVAYRRNISVVFPERQDMFKAYKKTQFSDVKVVIVGQDPYYTRDVADGLAFSSALATYLPPSLKEIYKAIEKDVHFGLFLDQNPCLDYLAEQGVLLLNRVLTVENKAPRSHYGIGWEQFTEETLKKLKDHPRDLVVMLWGMEARGCEQFIDNGRHLILTAEHPASAYRELRDWDYHNCFKKAERWLEEKGYGGINW